jgi:hypothetical protein
LDSEKREIFQGKVYRGVGVLALITKPFQHNRTYAAIKIYCSYTPHSWFRVAKVRPVKAYQEN